MSPILVIAMAFVLIMFSPPQASSAGATGGIPSKESLAHCITSCGDVADIPYPFGVGSGCFRQEGFQLTCNHSTHHHPKLFFARSSSSSSSGGAIQVTGMDVDPSGPILLNTPIIFRLATSPGTNTYNMSWESPAKGITLISGNTLFVAGCDLDVTLLEYYGTGHILGSCMTRCFGRIKQAPTGVDVPCNGIGCCLIPLPRDTGFHAKLVSTNTTATQSDWLHPGIMAFMTSHDYEYRTNTTVVFSRWTNNPINIYDEAVLSVSIMDQPSCESAQMHNASYACNNGSSCHNSSSAGTDGYWCSCPYFSYYSEDANPYILHGCRQEYNPKPHKQRCPKNASCGTINVPFPFGLQQGCSANDDRFLLNCTSGNLTLSVLGDAQYHVNDVSVEDGTLTVSNMVTGNHAKEVVLIEQTGNDGDTLTLYSLLEDKFDFFMEEYDVVIKWAVTNQTCQTAKQKGSMYACRSSYSDCLNVTHGDLFMGYRCKCSQGYQGNPYIKDGCTDIDECAVSNYCNGTCQNFPGSYTCTSCPHRKVFDPIKRQCVMSTKEHGLILGIATGTGCGLGSIIIALCAIVLANKWKKGIQKRIRRAHFKKNQGLLLEQLISDESATNKTKIFSLQELEKATNNFDVTRVLGRGGHGTVYKGILSD